MGEFYNRTYDTVINTLSIMELSFENTLVYEIIYLQLV